MDGGRPALNQKTMCRPSRFSLEGLTDDDMLSPVHQDDDQDGGDGDVDDNHDDGDSDD